MKFEHSQYYKLWESKEGRQIMTAILNNPDLIRANHTFWKTKFRVDPKYTPTNEDGEATFVSKMRQIQSGELMDLRAPLGDSRQADKGGIAKYTGSIPDFIAPGFVETATERYYKEQRISEFGDAQMLADFAMSEVQRMVDSANQTLSNLSAELLSTGQIIYKNGVGIHGGIEKAEIPKENFDTAGAKVWTDTSCNLLDQMVEKEKKYRDLWGQDFSLQWEVTRDMFNKVFLNNKQVIERYRYYKSMNNVLMPETVVLDEEMVKPVFAGFEGLSPIVIVEEKQKDVNKGIVHGWKDNIAVLRPVGYAGMIRRTEILDKKMFEKYGSSAISKNFTSTLDGVALLVNTVINNGNYKEWHTDLMMSAVPSLDEFLFHVIVDTSRADG